MKKQIEQNIKQLIDSNHDGKIDRKRRRFSVPIMNVNGMKKIEREMT